MLRTKNPNINWPPGGVNAPPPWHGQGDCTGAIKSDRYLSYICDKIKSRVNHVDLACNLIRHILIYFFTTVRFNKTTSLLVDRLLMKVEGVHDE